MVHKKLQLLFAFFLVLINYKKQFCAFFCVCVSVFS